MAVKDVEISITRPIDEATILGLAPLALGLGPGAQMQPPLAIAVIGGLIANMLLTRLLIPVGYLVTQGRPTVA
jgi:multidrug efflux pump subunit AcrB